MNLRWLLGNFTDPQHRLTRREQFQLSNIAHKKFLKPGDFVRASLLIIAPAIAALLLLKPVLRGLGYGGSTHAYTIALTVIVVLIWPWSAWMYRSLYRRPVRKAMREAGYDVCLGCGYELRGLPPDHPCCPECGELRSQD